MSDQRLDRLFDQRLDRLFDQRLDRLFDPEARSNVRWQAARGGVEELGRVNMSIGESKRHTQMIDAALQQQVNRFLLSL